MKMGQGTYTTQHSQLATRYFPRSDCVSDFLERLSNQSTRLSKGPKYRETVYLAIKEAILAGELAPNQPLIEEQLAASLQISRTPVREALAVLQHEAFIGPRAGRGLYVRQITHAEFIEMFVANEVIEPYLARRAALLASDQQLEAISEALQRGKGSIDQQDAAGFLRASRDFHRRLGEAAGNIILTEFVVSNEERTDMYLLNGEDARLAARTRGHYETLVQHDPEAAERRVIYHAQSLRERFADLFNAQE
jgi:DNA-binding GntR family transcriptional regulator